MSRRVEPRIVALSSAAVLAIYGAGYVLTQPTLDIRNEIAAAHAPKGPLRDGSFYGTGSSPFGDVTVALIVRSARIVDVRITGVTTYFSADWIASLPPEVVRGQSPRVDVVSGATASTAAFVGAVEDALSHSTGHRRPESTR